MKVAFFSNFLNHHQLPFCFAMQKQLGNDFVFVATQPFDAASVSKGYEDTNGKYDFCLCAYIDEAHKQQAMRLALDSDVMIIGSAPSEYWIERMEQTQGRKLTFRYSERLFKPNVGKVSFFTPWVLSERYRNLRYRHRAYYLLAIGLYAAADYKKLWMPTNKMFSWGYFPAKATKEFSELSKQKNKNDVPHILWTGRMLAWKHPQDLANALQRLANQFDFTCEFIGEGEELDSVKALCSIPSLKNRVTFTGALSHDEVRQHMEQSDFFALTSDYSEGWGAVLNEAMASGCACVASHATGAATSLLRHGENGLVYRSGDVDDLEKQLAMLLCSEEFANEMKKNAFNTIQETWNAENAAKNLLQLCEELQKGEKTLCTGPCEKINIVEPKEIYRFLT